MLGMPCSSIGAALFLFSVIICAISDSIRYRAKFFIFIILSSISATLPMPLMFLRIGDWRNALMPAWGARQIAKLIGINYELQGMENIVQESGAVVMINHQSNLDLCVLAELWPILQRCTMISKKQVLYFGTFGLAAWLWGTIFIDRDNKHEAKDAVNSTTTIIQQRRAKVLIYPEGKRHTGSNLLPFKKGGFHVAIDSQMPIQPVVVSRYYFINHKLKKFDSGISRITILPAIPTKGMSKAELPQLVEKTYQVMNKTYKDTTQEVLRSYMESFKLED